MYNNKKNPCPELYKMGSVVLKKDEERGKSGFEMVGSLQDTEVIRSWTVCLGEIELNGVQLKP